MEETLSLTEILAIFVKKAKAIIIFAIIGAIALGGFQFVRQITATPTASVDETADAIPFEVAMEKYETQLEILNANLDKVETKIKNQKEYNENSIIMSLNPFDVAVSTTVFQISGIDSLLAQPQYSNEAFTPSYFINTIQVQYAQYFNSIDFKAMFSAEYPNVAEQYLQEIVNFLSYGNGSFSIEVYVQDEKKAEKLGKMVSEYLLSMTPSVVDATYPHTFSIIDTNTKRKVVTSFDTVQKNNKSLYDGYVKEKEILQKQLDDLVEPTKANVSGKSIMAILVNTFKWIVLGGIFGAILVCAWFFVVMLFKTRIESSRQMEQMLAVPFLGSVAKKGDFWNRLANALLNERVWDDETSGTAYISENLKTVLDKETEVLVASTLKTKGIDEDIAVVSKSASSLCKKVYAISNAEKNPEMIVALTTCKYMILAERVGKSELTEMQAIIQKAKRKGVEVIGFVTI